MKQWEATIRLIIDAETEQEVVFKTAMLGNDLLKYMTDHPEVVSIDLPDKVMEMKNG